MCNPSFGAITIICPANTQTVNFYKYYNSCIYSSGSVPNGKNCGVEFRLMAVDGFLKVKRKDRRYRSAKTRVSDFEEFIIPLSDNSLQKQASRCMDCGIPYCMGDFYMDTGCPLGNMIPDFNRAVEEGRWRLAYDILEQTSPMSEVTGRVCPAPCEKSCVLNLNNEPVIIRTIECQIADKAWKEGWVVSAPPRAKTQFKVAVIGSGPAGLACAQRLQRFGFRATIYEKADKVGGLLRYGIPDYKLPKAIVDRRVAQLRGEGVNIWTNRIAGIDPSIKYLQENYDAIVLSTGSEQPRDLPIPGRQLKGIHFAMDYLTQTNRTIAGFPPSIDQLITAKDKNVIVIGGGDTGSDCIGTANRFGAKSILQITHGDKPPTREDKLLEWPYWPFKLETSSSHEEGCERNWSIRVSGFQGDKDGQVSGLNCIRLSNKKEIPDSSFFIPGDLVFICVGFTSPIKSGLIEDLKLDLDKRGNIITENFQTNKPKWFSCGDARRGQSLVVWALREGLECADAVMQSLVDHPPKV